MARPLAEYQRKRDFTRTAEPSGAAPTARGRRLAFVIQKHAASHLHFDLRLEMGGVMRSWAVPKGPSLDPAVRRLAMEVEDHPIAYNRFEGTIPAGEYGGGTVMLFDRGHYAPADAGGEASLERDHAAGRLEIELAGERLQGGWRLVRTRPASNGRAQWLLIKRNDDHAAAGSDVVADITTSVATGRTMEEIAGGHGGASARKAGARKTTERTVRAKKATVKKATVKKATVKKATVKKATVKKATVKKKVATRKVATTKAPAALEPMLASIGTVVPAGEGWTFEPKYDGIRVLAFATPTGARLVTRNGNDKAAQFPEVADAVRALAARARRPLVLDGEIVALVGGVPARFQALQGRMHSTDADAIASHAEGAPATLVAFDVLLDGDATLLHMPWTVRRARLARILRTPLAGGRAERLLLSDTETGDGEAMLVRARAAGWEGMIAKRVDATYTPGRRSADWLKLKVEHRQEFVVGGYTEPRNTRQHLGALLLGQYDTTGQLVYSGHAGGGFTAQGLADMARRLRPLAARTSPFTTKVRTNEPARWVRPKVVVEVKFLEWTDEGRLRQPIVVGVRDDKDAREVRREGASVQGTGAAKKAAAKKTAAKKTAAKKTAAKTKAVAKKVSREPAPDASDRSPVAQLARIESAGGDGTLALGRGATLAVSNLGKTYFPADGYTKGDLMRWYAEVAPLLLPAIADRPLVLRRFPGGIDGQAFYQHDVPDPPAHVRTEVVDVNDDGIVKRHLVGGDLATLLYATQLGAVSVDPFHARVPAVREPDYTIIDLDPGDDAPFARVVEVARRVRAELDALGLRAGLKTSGATGLHVVLPLPPRTRADAALLLAQLVATRVAAAMPREATIERSVRARATDAVYVDYLQNIPGKTVAAAYSVRARPGATVSAPLDWEELVPSLDPRAFTIRTMPARLAKVGDLWRAAMRDRNPVRALRELAGAGTSKR